MIAQGKVAGAGERYGWSDPSYVVDHTTGEIFAFFVGSLDAGFGYNPNYAMNPDGTVNIHHRSAMNFTVANSKDNGHTWQRRTITNEVLGSRATQVRGCFATSGAGIQKCMNRIRTGSSSKLPAFSPMGGSKPSPYFQMITGKPGKAANSYLIVKAPMETHGTSTKTK
ncbi:sialidase family protein [Arcanobacterium hippocoleae]|uniref:sialidase family protein n=1 Tax=Arcanobacterium hippocoleae TaxID=149017 RepID=UPI0033415153